MDFFPGALKQATVENSILFHTHTKHSPTSGPLHLLFSVRKTLQISRALSLVHSHLESNVTSERPSPTAPFKAEAHASPPLSLILPYLTLQHLPPPTLIYSFACCHLPPAKPAPGGQWFVHAALPPTPGLDQCLSQSRVRYNGLSG